MPIKMTPEQILEEVQKIVKPLAEKVNVLESQRNQPIPTGQNTLNAHINHGGISPELQKEFLQKLDQLMIQYKIITLTAFIAKKE